MITRVINFPVNLAIPSILNMQKQLLFIADVTETRNVIPSLFLVWNLKLV